MKTASKLMYVFAVIGLLMLLGASWMVKDAYDFIGAALTTDGKVLRLETRSSDDGATYAPVVEFMARNGRQYEFTSSSSSNPPAYAPGEPVEVLYLQENPFEARINGFMDLWFGPSVVGFLGLIFFGIGSYMLIRPRLKRHKRDDLLRTGMLIETTFQRADVVDSLEVNGRNPYRIASQWQNPLTKKIHVFESNNIWFDPLEYIKTDTISVWIDRDDYDRYYMDIAFLPELAD